MEKICQKERRDAIIESLYTILGKPRFGSSDGTYVTEIVNGRYEPVINSKGKKRLEYSHEYSWLKDGYNFDVHFYDDGEISVFYHSYNKGEDEIRCYEELSIPILLMTASDFVFGKLESLMKNNENDGIPLMRSIHRGDMNEP